MADPKVVAPDPEVVAQVFWQVCLGVGSVHV